MNIKKLVITKMSHRGHGIGIHDNKEIYVLGAYIGDVVSVEVYKKAEGISYGELTHIITPSQGRMHIPQIPPFFEANAPFEHLSLKAEQDIKKSIVHDVFAAYPALTITSDIAKPSHLHTHYRNKAAYSFMNHKGKLAYALFPRGIQSKKKVLQEENILVHEMINTAAKQFLHFFNQKNMILSDIKYLILRYSYASNTVTAHILLPETSRKKLPWKKKELETYADNNKNIQGILVSHSNPKIRSSITTKDFYHVGNITITEEVLGMKYHYHPSSFFQIYPEAFSEILKDISQYIKEIPKVNTYPLIDLFSGIGIIGIHLSEYVKNVISVEHSPLSKEYGLMNALENNIKNFEFFESSVDDSLKVISHHQILVVDPPRSGLTKDIRQSIQQTLPEYIIYISCNTESQAYDLSEIIDNYSISFSKGYNLFPKTAHVEHVVILKRKNRG